MPRDPMDELIDDLEQVLPVGEVRLDPGTTKNDEGRVFPFTAALRELLEEQRRQADRLREKGLIARYVFFHFVEMKDGTLGKKSGDPITPSGFAKAWRRAREKAGCPDRIPPRFPPHGRAQPRASRCTPVSRDEAHRPQDRVGVSALCYRECRGAAVGGAPA